MPERSKQIEMFHVKKRLRVMANENRIEDYKKQGYKTADEIRKETPPDPAPAPALAPAPDAVSDSDDEE